MSLEVMQRLAAASPGFVPVLARFRDDWAEEPATPWYVGIGEFAHYLATSYEQGQTQDFAAVFSVVEELLASADERTANLLVVGLFEDLQNIASHRAFAAGVFRAWLGPVGVHEWDRIEAHMCEVQEWLNRTYRRHWWQFWRPRYPGLVTVRQLETIENVEVKRVAESMYRRPPTLK